MHRLRHSDESPTGSRLYSFSLGVDNDLSIGAYVLQNTTPIAVMYTANITLAASNSTNSTNFWWGLLRERAVLGVGVARYCFCCGHAFVNLEGLWPKI